MKFTIRTLVIGFLVIIIAGCATHSQQLATPSGNPEIVITNTTRKEVIDKIVTSKLEKGMQLKSVNDYGVVLGAKADGSFAASFLYGSRYDSTPEVRLTYNVVETPGGVRVFSRAEMVTNPGSAYERVSNITRTYSTQMQSELEELQAALAN